MPAQPTSTLKHEVSQVNVVRAVAMLGVFLHHLGAGVGPCSPGLADQTLVQVMRSGVLGVVLFNLTTGFVLARSAARQPPRLAPFLKARLWRICPEYYLAALGAVAVNALILRDFDLAGLGIKCLRLVLFLQNLDLGFFQTNMAAFWWLGLLVQFYLVFPTLQALSRRFGTANACLGSCLVSWGLAAWLEWGAGPGLKDVHAILTFNLPYRLPEFAFGMWLASMWRETEAGPPVDRRAVMPLVVLAGLALASPLPVMAFAGQGMAIFLVLMLLPASRRLGVVPGVAFLAARSYAIYLVHQPLMSYLAMAAGLAGIGWPGCSVSWSLARAGLISAVASLAVAWLVSLGGGQLRDRLLPRKA